MDTGVKRSARIAAGRALAAAQRDADRLAALLLRDLSRHCDVLEGRGGSYRYPCRAVPVAVLAAAGAPALLAELYGLRLSSDILGLLNKRLGAEYTSSLDRLDRAATGRLSAAEFAAFSQCRREFLAELLQAGQAGGLPCMGYSCLSLARVAVAAACQPHQDVAAGVATATATVEFLLDIGACQEDCADAAVTLYERLHGSFGPIFGEHCWRTPTARDKLEAASGVWRWLLQQSRKGQGRLLGLGDTTLRSVLTIAAAEGDIDGLRHFASQLAGACPPGTTVGDMASIAERPGWEVIRAGVFASDATFLQRLVLELPCGSGSSSSSPRGNGSPSGSPARGTPGRHLLVSSSMRSTTGWELLQIAALHSLQDEGLALEAAHHGRQAALRAMLQAGLPITLRLMYAAASFPNVRLLRWLLSAGPLPVPDVLDRSLYLFDYDTYRRSWNPVDWYQGCPIWHSIRLAEPVTPGRCLDQHAVQVVEALREAGYRPSVFTRAKVCVNWGKTKEYARFDPATDDNDIEIEGVHRYLWLAANPVPWSPQQHTRFPPAFQDAARTLLLAAQRGSAARQRTCSCAARRRSSAAAAAAAAHGKLPAAAGSGAGGTGRGGRTGLGVLPHDVLLRIAGHAAYPISEWSVWGERAAR